MPHMTGAQGTPAAPPWAAPPAAWAPGMSVPGPAHGWGGGKTTAAPAARPRWPGTIVVAAVVAAVVLGGASVDAAVPAPSAGEVAISGPIHITAGPGWILTDSLGQVEDGIVLQGTDGVLIAQLLDTSYSGDERRLLASAKIGLRAEAGAVTFGQERDVTLNGIAAAEVSFSALVSDAGSSGVIDGELVCVVLKSGGDSYAVVLEALVPQGDLGSVRDAVDQMAGTLKVVP
jgi:hypothetical protein